MAGQQQSTHPPDYLVVPSGQGSQVEFGGAEIAGRLITGQGRGELLVRGAGTMLVRLQLAAGFDQDGHRHPDHESIGYVLSGRIEMSVGGTTHILSAGATWYHPRGVHHTCRALEDSELLEFHAPLRPDVLSLFAAGSGHE
jgi:quercetin dioxygenase-like cupin family protein